MPYVQPCIRRFCFRVGKTRKRLAENAFKMAEPFFEPYANVNEVVHHLPLLSVSTCLNGRPTHNAVSAGQLLCPENGF